MVEEDQHRLLRLLRRTLGTGFKLAFVEVSDARDRKAVLDWLAPVLQSLDAAAHPLDVRDLVDPKAGENFNLWSVLREAIPPESLDPREVLTLWGFENLMYRGRTDRSQLLQQINVQRDILVRDYPCWWLLFVHPASRQQWWSVAPDFCDLASIWSEAPDRSHDRKDALAPAQGEPSYQRMPASAPTDTREWPSLLRLASEHLRFSRFAEALDAIHSFRAGAAKTARTRHNLTIAEMLEAPIRAQQGDPRAAIRLLQEQVIPVFERTRQPHLRAIAIGALADLLEMQGDLDEALRIRRQEELPVYERLGDVRSRAVTMGKIADILRQRGETDEALRTLREELLPVFEQMGDVRDRAVTMGKIADILQQRGETDEALRTLREELLPVFERLGDVRSRAVTMGKIADILQQRGEMDEALRIRQEEELPVYERLADVYSSAITIDKIGARLRTLGDREGAKTAYEEALPIYERVLGSEHPTTKRVRSTLDSLD